ncbi:hypothetical protein [Nannocystis radixulma]|uniref:Uncharacterized protein n=1 Tax=Nannocystis radixulma TaxID=2995305 RepID=A0ABT5BAH6_9BACT|nr:hypothetical protein [Nannocystis radixulma]MDC0671143.1 hypothetical protein [Nannocystis radixulma]
MLDLKAKLAAAGLVTQEQVAAAERKKAGKPAGAPAGRPAAKPAPAPVKPKSGLDVAALKKAGKSEIYDTTRRVVDRTRLDPVGGLPSERAEAFHFPTAQGSLGRLTLEPELHAQITDGRAAIVAYMSHHGLAHCVVPRAVADDLAEVMPLWLRVCKDHPAAGQLAPPPAPREDRGAKPTQSG